MSPFTFLPFLPLPPTFPPTTPKTQTNTTNHTIHLYPIPHRRPRTNNFLLSLHTNPPPPRRKPNDNNNADIDTDTLPTPSATPTPTTPTPKRKTRRLSAESRAKISAALKGRAKSAAHRASLRRRFEGDRNPMYGRKLSAETRAKISAAMTGRTRKRREKQVDSDGTKLTESTKEALRAKAVGSRLLKSERGDGLDKNEQRRLKDVAEQRYLEEVLRHVRKGERPPQSVVKVMERDRRLRRDRGGRAEKKWKSCANCGGSGFVECGGCTRAFGVASARCSVCFGAGAVFCDVCLGVGQVAMAANG